MKYKTLFRMLLKAVGVWLFAEGLQGFVSGIALWSSVFQLPPNTRFGAQWWLSIAQVMAGPVIQIAIGLYLFFGGAWIANKAYPGNRPYCAECGYDLTGSIERCPECGTVVRQLQIRQPISEPNDLKSQI